MPASPLTAPENELLAKLARQGRSILLTPQDLPLITGIVETETAARALVNSLAEKDWLVQVRRGVWAIRSRALSIEATAIEVIGYVTPDPHLVTAGRALREHRLSDQTFRSLVVMTPHRLRSWEWQGERVKYVLTPRERIWGAAERSPLLPTRIANEERALLDALAHPRWGVSLAHLTEALDRYLERTGESDKLALATARYKNAHLARRFGFLIEQLAGEAKALPFRALRGSTKGAIPLNRLLSTEHQPHLNTRWGIRHQDTDILLGIT